MAPLCVFISLILCSCARSENHEHHGDDKWQAILSQIGFLWMNNRTVVSTSTEQNDLSSRRGHNSNHRHQYSELPTEVSSTDSLQKGIEFEEVKERFKLGLAAIISIPIVGIIFLICICYCCCKCCCSSDTYKEHNVVVLQNNQVAGANTQTSTTQVILQQPVYQSPASLPPPYEQQPSVQPGYWPGPQQYQQQPLYHPNIRYDDPKYAQPPSAPPKY